MTVHAVSNEATFHKGMSVIPGCVQQVGTAASHIDTATPTSQGGFTVQSKASRTGQQTMQRRQKGADSWRCRKIKTESAISGGRRRYSTCSDDARHLDKKR